MTHRLRSAFWALWYVMKYDNALTLRGGYLFIRQRSVDKSYTKNGIMRIPL